MDKETKEWMYISNFVGILLDKDRLFYLYQNQLLLKIALIKKYYSINMQDYLYLYL